MFGLSLGTIASLALGVIRLATNWFERIQDEALRQAGEDREKLKQLAALQAISRTLKDIDERFARMTDDEIKKTLDEQGDFRD